MNLVEVHERVQAALEHLMPIRGQLEGDFSLETALAIGEISGFCVRVKALIERDFERSKNGQEKG